MILFGDKNMKKNFIHIIIAYVFHIVLIVMSFTMMHLKKVGQLEIMKELEIIITLRDTMEEKL